MHYMSVLWRVKTVLAKIHGGIETEDVLAGMFLSKPPLGYTSGGLVDLKDELEKEFEEELLALDRDDVLQYQIVRDIANNISCIVHGDCDE